jgi:hypothetical protein
MNFQIRNMEETIYYYVCDCFPGNVGENTDTRWQLVSGVESPKDTDVSSALV